MNHTTLHEGGIDGMLSSYFKAEMPTPWPEFREPSQPALAARSARWQGYTRLAVAASVALLLAGYLAVAGFFPRERSNHLPNTGTIGLKSALPLPK